MSADDRFRPPTAAVADVKVEPGDPRAAIIALGAAGLMQLSWVVFRATTYLYLVNAGALRPIGLLFAIGGLGYLYFGIARLVLRANVGRRHFVFALIGHLSCLASWWSGGDFIVLPFILGGVLAGVGLRIVLFRPQAAQPQEAP